MKIPSSVFPAQFTDFRRPHVLLLSLAVLLHVALAYRVDAATIIWSGPTGADTNWSTGSNWTNATAGTSGTAPASGDDVKFFDAGSVGSASNINNTVDASFPGTIASLQFGNTNNTHTTLISSGTTLNIAGASGLVVGTPGDLGVAKVLTNTITGAGGTLNLNNASASLVLNQGTAASVTGTRAILDLSGLDSFTMNGNRIGIGTTTLANPGSANQREAGLLYLAKTNLITLATSAALATYQSTASQNPAIELSHNPGNNAGILSILYLGQVVNAFQPVAFAVAASGVFGPNYQWRKDGSPLPGATSATLNLSHTHFTDAGGYDCIVTNINGVLVSSNATLTVNTPTQPSVSAVAISSGQFTFTVAGDVGPDYAIQASTNLVDWQTIFTTNSPLTPFDFADPNTSAYSESFYRVAVGPPLP